MSLKFQNYDPSTKTFKPSMGRSSHNRLPQSKKPGGTTPKLLLGLSPEMSEQGVEVSDESLPSARLQASSGLIDLTRSDMLPQERSTSNCQAPILVENDVNTSADLADKDEVMTDMDDDFNDHGRRPAQGASSRLEQGQRADLAAGEEWEITELMGREVIDGKVYYLIHWTPTLVPEDEINAPNLISRFEARFGAKSNTMRPTRIAKQPRLTKMRKDGKEMPKCRPGRPRKEVS
ncbi:hypothetical protein HYQ44_017023 [Verticillium longisporum]|nr:hypothetical protein HYQ44_017023 [Verticillium longisporum]